MVKLTAYDPSVNSIAKRKYVKGRGWKGYLNGCSQALAGLFGVGVNDLPLTLVVS